jgi:hypothetical protein
VRLQLLLLRRRRRLFLRPSSSSPVSSQETDLFTSLIHSAPLLLHVSTQKRNKERVQAEAGEEGAVEDTPEKKKTGGSLRAKEDRVQEPKEESNNR